MYGQAKTDHQGQLRRPHRGPVPVFGDRTTEGHDGVRNPADPFEGVHDDPALQLWLRRRRVNERELHRLEESWDGPCVELPLVPFDRGVGLTRELATLLDASLGAEER